MANTIRIGKRKPLFQDLTESEARTIQRAEKSIGRKTHAVKKKSGKYDVYKST